MQLDGVDQVPVVGQREGAMVITDDRLGVLPLRGAGRGVAHVADRHVADQRAQDVLVEYLGDEALVADRHQAAAALGGRDPRRLLASMLQCEQGEVRQSGDVVLRREDPEDTALVARAIAMFGPEPPTRPIMVIPASASAGPGTVKPWPRASANGSVPFGSVTVAPIEP